MAKWNKDNITEELEKVIEKIGHFPTKNELLRMKKSGLSSTISDNGGVNYFREIMGYKLSKWNESNIVEELEKVIERIGHFPTRNELNEMKKSRLVYAMSNNGGLNHFRKKMGHEIICQTKGHWDDESYSGKIKNLQMLKRKEKDEIIKLQIKELIMFFEELKKNGD